MKEAADIQRKPFGTWLSQVSEEMISSKLRLEDTAWNSDGKSILWLENRSGRGVLVSRKFPHTAVDVTVANNVRGGVGYGGGEFTIQNGNIVFSDKNGRLYLRSGDFGEPRAIIPAFGAVASPCVSPDDSHVLYVYSEEGNDGLGLADLSGKTWPRKLATGADFYSQPGWHPSGKYIAWIEWQHPQMPWDGTLLKLAQIDRKTMEILDEQVVFGNAHTPVSQPLFSPDGKWLSFITTRDEWDSLVLYHLETKQITELVGGDKMVLSLPAWTQSIHTCDWKYDSTGLYYLVYKNGCASLWFVDLKSAGFTKIDTAPYTWMTQLSASPVDDQLLFIAGGPRYPERIIRLDSGNLIIERYSTPESIDPQMLSIPQYHTWKADDGTDVHGYYYPPSNDRYTEGGAPPVIVNVHGGPSSAHVLTFSPEIAFFTTRGYGWMEVNYRGSTGYGRSYQDALQHRWGEVDVEDVLSAADILVEKGLADEKRLIVKGGSAGGYTVLNCLIKAPGKFKAGICLYGISNLFTLSETTHKFEAKYNDFLIGELPEAAERFYRWSAVYHADRIRDALAVFQGKQDVVVPPQQAEEIVQALQKNKVPYIYRLYEDEGHGFRGKQTITDYLQQVQSFLARYVLNAP